jgi:glycosyltransferase involved in cell wall biosynthesis
VKVLSLTKYGEFGASSRLRTMQYIKLLNKEGINITVQHLISNKSLLLRYKIGKYPLDMVAMFYLRRLKTLLKDNNFDLIWIEKEALPWFPVWLEIMLFKGIPYILDFDDATFHNYDQHKNNLLRFFYGSRLDKLMSKASLVICGNSYLESRAIKAGSLNTLRLPTAIDLEKYQIKKYINKANKRNLNYQFKVVWIGSPSTQHYLKIIKKPLQILARKYHFIFQLIGSQEIVIPSIQMEIIPWSEDTEASLIRNSDIGVMPLPDMPWERGKCGYKIIQYMASGLPVIASPVGVNKDLVLDGVNGFLANNDQQWIKAFEDLFESKDLRIKMGLCGREIIEKKYSISITAPKLIKSLKLINNK